MKVVAVLALVLVALFVFVTPANAKRDGGGDGRKGCNEEHWEVVIERDEFRLCLFEK